MKKDPVLAFVLGLLTLLLAGVGTKVWQGVEIAQKNEIRLEHVRETQEEIKANQEELRDDLDRLWANASDLAAEIP